MNLKLLAYKLRRFLLGLLYAGKTGGFSSRPYINGAVSYTHLTLPTICSV